MNFWSRAAENATWFIVSLFLAFTVWYVANIQSDPIQAQQFQSIPVQMMLDDSMVLVNQPTTTVRVNLRAQRSTLQSLARDDITVTADLTGKPAGTHTIPLVVRVNRSGVIATDTQPTQITAILETISAQQKPINLNIVQPPSADYNSDAPVSDLLQAEVRGASGKVDSVVELRGDLDLSGQKGLYTTTLNLVPVDADGNRVTDVAVNPSTAAVTVNIYPRPDVRQLTVRPNIQFETMAPGYVFQSIRTEPELVYLSGTPAALTLLGDTISTLPIDLTGKTGNFTVDVPLDLPSDDLLVLNGENSVRVEIGLGAQIMARQIDNVPVDVIGVPPNATVTLNPPTISVIVAGPFDTMQTLSADDVQAVIDVNGLDAGSHSVTPRITLQQGTITPDSSQVLPATITVTINMPTPQPSATP
jgi:YbbR domain-containing protein